MFAGTFTPRGWASCDGQLLAIMQNTALFSLLGTIYGGDGRTTFGLPDLRSRVPIHAGPKHKQGSRSGQEEVTLNVTELPAHTHEVQATNTLGTESWPSGALLARSDNVDGNLYSGDVSSTVSLAQTTTVGSGLPHPNMQPFLPVRFIIAMVGVFPSRS